MGNRERLFLYDGAERYPNGESGMHVLNIRLITELLLKQLCAVTDQYCEIRSKIPLIANASALHDIGKISIDEKILNKPGRLTAEEYEIMKFHSAAGANMLEKTQYYPDEELVRIARDICRWHHERYDGMGYPDGLVGDAIPIEAQVVALADVYDALTHKRVYKEAYSHETVSYTHLREQFRLIKYLFHCLNHLSVRSPRRVLTAAEVMVTGITLPMSSAVPFRVMVMLRVPLPDTLVLSRLDRLSTSTYSCCPSMS